VTGRSGPDGLADSPEFDAVREILAGGTPRTGPLDGAGDDAARLSDDLVISTDMAVEGTHFELTWVDAAEAGRRSALAALSDLAAVGARPHSVVAALAGRDRAELVAAGRGIREATERVGGRLVGGDLAATDGPLTLAVTVVGSLDGHRPLARSAARPGDALFVTGELGASAAAVAAWNRGAVPDPEARAAFVDPRLGFEAVAWLRDRAVLGAAIDLSDGLAIDARHVARASGVRIVVEADAIPVAAAASAGRGAAESLELALTGGEDYQLLLGIRDPSADLEAACRAATGVRLTRVGSVESGEGAILRSPDGLDTPLAGGFGHWNR
jgi:thiamine-monophosphate kinase